MYSYFGTKREGVFGSIQGSFVLALSNVAFWVYGAERVAWRHVHS
jgi:hypothetical protein